MCGISGSLSLGEKAADPQLIQQMIARIEHRGPDGSGVYTDDRVGLGHVRLSILDLEGGNQPMPAPDRSVWITFNGEVFNYVELRKELIEKGHRFATRSDTEVILHLYQEEGERCVERLNGQWAFAIWDVPEQKLFLSRDRFGVRPLFYTQAAGTFLFASEIKALLACPEVESRLDLLALDQIFTFWVTLPPRTAFKNIWQLPPGHSLVIENGRIRTWAYWRLEYNPEDHTATDNEKALSEQLLALLLDATRLRLRSDVPVGTYLSGGLDSTIITALTKALAGDRVKSFSVTFDDAAFDESAYQREAATYLETDNSNIHCTSEDIAGAFPAVIRSTEQPILRTAPAPLFLLSRLVRESGFKVVLTGEGADEVLGGYDIFKEAKIRSFWKRNPSSTWRPRLLRRLYPYMDGIHRQPPAYLQRSFHVTADPAGPFFSHLPRWELTAKLKTFFSDAVRSELGRYDSISQLQSLLPNEYPSWHTFLQAQFLETTYLLPGYILSSQGDRVAMAHAVEGRFPFLDHRVVDFASRLPVRLKMKVLQEKYLLKRSAQGFIPPAVIKRNKQPYRAPDGKCFLQKAAREYTEHLLSPDCIQRYGIFAPLPVAKLLSKFRSDQAIGTKDNMAFVGIISTQLFIHQFVDHSTTRMGSNGYSRRPAAVCS